MSISTQAMVLNLSIGVWQGYRLDKEASRRVTEEANADTDAARVNKHLVPRESFKDITSAASAVRNHFYAKTLPWKDNGDRLLPRAIYTKFIEEHERLHAEFKQAVRYFLETGYPIAVEKARFRMGDLFDINDYPAPRELASRFYLRIDIDAVTEAHDFRVEMEQSQLDTIRSDIESALQLRLKQAMTDVWDRVHAVVERFVERTSDPKAIFRDSLVSNITDLVDILPGLNIMDDPQLSQIGEDLSMMLKGVSPADLRKHPEVRSEAADEASRILDDMRGFINAFQAAA